MHVIFIQAFYYSIVMALSIGLIGVMQKGFFFKYCKVRFSFGRLIMVKIRSPIRDYFSIGRIEDEVIVYGLKKRELRCNIKKNYNAFYRCLSVLWIDIDEETNSICSVEYTSCPGYDAKKFSDILVRALTRPIIGDNKEKIIMVCIFIAVIASGAAAYIALKNQEYLVQLINRLPQMFQSMKGTIVSGGSL